MYDEKSVIEERLPRELIKFLIFNALRIDINNLNLKAKIVSKVMTTYGFTEIGTGTNRVVFSKDGLLFKVAIDRRGLIDNITEFKRAEEVQEILAMTFETNVVVTVSEYATVMDREIFRTNQETIKEILADLSESYLFDDIGFTLKNAYNWGYRTDPDGNESVIVIDYGYMYPLMGQDMDTLFKCRSCGKHMRMNSNYTKYICENSTCSVSRTPSQIEELMEKDILNIENQMVAEIPTGKELNKMISGIMELI